MGRDTVGQLQLVAEELDLSAQVVAQRAMVTIVCAAWYDQSSGRPTPRSIGRWVRLLPEPSLPLPSFVMMITER